jgi:hypothetical protein
LRPSLANAEEQQVPPRRCVPPVLEGNREDDDKERQNERPRSLDRRPSAELDEKNKNEGARFLVALEE